VIGENIHTAGEEEFGIRVGRTAHNLQTRPTVNFQPLIVVILNVKLVHSIGFF
jgi:hypothetical protein